MKKITYLVAPLMVMPFLIGCNKVTTHKVASVLTVSGSLKFTTMKGKELKGTSFNEKQDFKFKVEAADEYEANYTVDPNGIGIYVGKNATFPLLDGYTVKVSDDKKTAEVTISADKMTDDLYIDGIAAKADNYIYCVPFLSGVQMQAGKPTLGWQPKNGALNLEFAGIDSKHAYPTQNCFLISNGTEYHYANDGTNWIRNHGITIEDDYAYLTGTTYLTVASGYTENYLLITARTSTKSSFLDSLSWDEIKQTAESGYAKYLFNLGEIKHVSLKTTGDVEVEHTVKIIGFDHDTITGTEAKAGITFQFATAISDGEGDALETMWDKESQTGDFEQSHINKLLKGTVLSYLPPDLRNVIKTVTKKVGKYSNDEWAAADYNAQLFPLADIEVSEDPETYYGNPVYCADEEGATYTYYKTSYAADPYSRRAVKDVNGNSCYCWLRSPNTYYTNGYANYILSTGYLGNGTYANQTYVVAPAFCI